jgi:sulfoxide reductase heme-binding subunit YedZ
MSAIVAGASGSQYLWFISRGSGLVLLVLFSVVFVLGVATRLGSAPRGLARFAVAELHRTLSLFAVVLLAMHIATALLDPYVSIGWAAAIIPLASAYRGVAIGLGAVAVDLTGAVLITSLLRARLSFRVWKSVHWLAYLAWPVAFAHSLTAGNDLRIWWVALVECVSAGLVGTAVVARLLDRSRADRQSPGPGARASMAPATDRTGHLTRR